MKITIKSSPSAPHPARPPTHPAARLWAAAKGLSGPESSTTHHRPQEEQQLPSPSQSLVFPVFSSFLRLAEQHSHPASHQAVLCCWATPCLLRGPFCSRKSGEEMVREMRRRATRSCRGHALRGNDAAANPAPLYLPCSDAMSGLIHQLIN